MKSTLFFYLRVLFIFLVVISCSQNRDNPPAQDNPGKPGGAFDVLIDTDLGGDPDDIQSLFRLVHYSDILKVKGIVSTPCNQIEAHPWDTIPRKELISEWIRRIDVEHLRGRGYQELMTEDMLLSLVKDGSQSPGAPTAGRSSEGAEWITSQALMHSQIGRAHV